MGRLLAMASGIFRVAATSRREMFTKYHGRAGRYSEVSPMQADSNKEDEGPSTPSAVFGE